MIAYFDTGAFDSLYRRDGCTAADVAALRKSIYGRGLAMALSVHHLEELVLARRVAPQALSAQIRFMLSLASLRSLLKPSADLLFDEIRAYATSGAAGSPFLHGPMADAISAGVAELVESDGEEIGEEFTGALERARRTRVKLSGAIMRARAAAAASADDPIAAATRALAESAGALADCDRRGIDGLLRLRVVRMAAGVAAAPAPPPTLEHAIAAAARAETIVSADSDLRELIDRLALEGLAARDLPAFLTTVRGAE